MVTRRRDGHAAASSCTLRQWLGLLIGFAGIVLLVWPDITAGGAGGRDFALGVRRGADRVRRLGGGLGLHPPPRHAARRARLGGAADVLRRPLHDRRRHARSASGPGSRSPPRTTVAFVYLSVVGSVVAFAAYSYALRHLDVAIVSLYSYINPMIAVALGTICSWTSRFTSGCSWPPR